MNYFLPMYTLASREWVRFYRQRSRIIGSLGTPIFLWFFLGSGLQAAFPGSGAQGGRPFLEYFFPANLVQTILFTSIFSNMSLIEDRHEGFLQSVLVSPIPRSSMVLGKVMGVAFITLFQGLLFMCLAPVAGIALTVPVVLKAMGAMFALGFTFSALGFFCAWWVDSVQGFHSVMNLVLFPMWLLSGAFFPIAGAPSWLRPVMWLNPASFGVSALQQAVYPPHTEFLGALPSYATSVVVSLGFGVFFLLASAYAVYSGKGRNAL